METTATFDSLIILLDKLFSGGRNDLDELLAALGAWTVFNSSDSALQVNGDTIATWRSLLQQLPLDERSFNDMYAPRTCDAFVNDLSAWCLGFRSQSESFQRSYKELFAFLSLLLITWLGVNESDRRRTASPDSRPSSTSYAPAISHDCDRLCRALLRDPVVRQTILHVYAPGDRESENDTFEKVTLERWGEVDPDSVSFHRHGTTSVILKGRVGVRDKFALKLILFPFLRFRSIARQTREYRSRYNPADRASNHMVDIWASTERWILMDFVDGITLSELLPRRWLVEEKQAKPTLSFSQILCDQLSALPAESEAPSPGTGQRLLDLTLDELLRLADTKLEQPPARRSNSGEKVSQRWMETFGGALFDALGTIQKMAAAPADGTGTARTGPKDRAAADSLRAASMATLPRQISL